MNLKRLVICFRDLYVDGKQLFVGCWDFTFNSMNQRIDFSYGFELIGDFIT